MGAFQAFPYHWLIQPSEAELQDLTSRHHVTVLRYSMPANSTDAEHGYHAVYTGADYDFDVLSSWARKNVRRGLRNCNVSRISFERYVNEGWPLRADTLARQARHRETKETWRRNYLAAADLEGFEIWAAEVQGKLGATVVTCQIDGWVYMVCQQCHSDYLREHVNNALSFVVTQNFIRRPGIQGIFYGMKSLDAPASIDEFKFRMGYEAKPVRQRVVFHRYLAPLVNPYSHRVAKLLVAAIPSSHMVAKAEGMLRACLEQSSPALKEGLACNPPRTS
jgi:hypothetical protein